MTTNQPTTSLLEHLAVTFKDSGVELIKEGSYQFNGIFGGDELKRVAISAVQFLESGRNLILEGRRVSATDKTYDLSYVGPDRKGYVVTTTLNSRGAQLSVDTF